MKKLLTIALITILLCTCCAPALAASLPAKAARAIEEAGWEGYKAAIVYTKGPPGLVYAVMRKGDRNLLCVLEHDSRSEEYRLLAANVNVLPPGRITPKFTYHDFPGEFYIEYSIPKPAPGQPAKVVLQSSDDGLCVLYAELTYPAGEDGLSLQDTLLPYGVGTYAVARNRVDRRGEYVESVEEFYISRAGWVYDLPSFSLEQALTDIAYARRGGRRSPPPLLVPVPADLLAGAEAGELIRFDDLFVSVDATYLDLSSRGLTDVAALAGLNAVEQLYLANNQITDLRPLAGLVNLRTLNIRKNQVEDLAPLSGLQKLDYLRLEGNDIADFSPLYGLTGLAKLHLNADTDAGQLEELRRELNHCEIVLETLPEEKPEVFESGKWKYVLSEEGGAVLVGYTEKPRGKLKIPGELDGHAVTGIGERAFYSSDLKSITIPEGVAFIGDQAFSSCFDLTGVTLPDSVTHIGSRAFDNTSLRGDLVLPINLVSIGAGAFDDVAIRSLTIPASVAEMDGNPFAGCSDLRSIDVDEENAAFESVGGVLFDKGRKTLIAYPAKLPRSAAYEIPQGVTSIGPDAFLRCINLKSMTIPDSVTNIGTSAFSWCRGLTEVTIPNSVTVIGNAAFRGCSGMTSVTLPDNGTVIGEGAFSYCTALTSVTIPGSMASVGSWAFKDSGGPHGSGLKEVTILPGVTSISEGAFYACNALTSVTIPGTVADIGNEAFSECFGLTAVTIPDGVISIGDRSFSTCFGLKSVTIPSSVVSIGDGAFQYCSKLVLTVQEGSYAEQYAKENNIPYMFATE